MIQVFESKAIAEQRVSDTLKYFAKVMQSGFAGHADGVLSGELKE